MNNQMNPADRHVWALAQIVEKLADTAYRTDNKAFLDAAGCIDGLPGQIMRGIASFAWMANNFPRDIGGEAERMREAMQLIGLLAETANALIEIETRVVVDKMIDDELRGQDAEPGIQF